MSHTDWPTGPDGQLFIDLHGHSRDAAPIEPAAAVDHMLRALGTTGQQIPGALDARTALLRSWLSGRRGPDRPGQCR